MIINALIHTLIKCLIGYLFIAYIPKWLKVTGIIDTILKIIGILIILSALLDWI